MRWTAVLRGTWWGLLATFSGAMVLAILALSADPIAARQALATELLAIVAVVIAGAVAGRRAGEAGLAHGAAAGVAFVLLGLLIGLATGGSWPRPTALAMQLLTGAALGAIAGMLGVNLAR